MMKTIIINGSPRKKGNTMTLINEIKKHLMGDLEVISTYDESIKPCTDCRYCWRNDHCIIRDRMDVVYASLYDADNIILASPLNFSQITGSLLSMASRLQFFYASKRIRKDKKFKLKPKQGGVILVAGGDTKDISPALATARIVLREANAQLIDYATSLNTDQLPASQDLEALTKILELAGRLNDGYTNR